MKEVKFMLKGVKSWNSKLNLKEKLILNWKENWQKRIFCIWNSYRLKKEEVTTYLLIIVEMEVNISIRLNHNLIFRLEDRIT